MSVKEKTFISILILILFLLIPIYSNAALQANGNAGKTDTLDGWMLSIRKMEETGGTLGLNDRINTTNLTSTLSTSNNLDIHLQKNTEYGAMAILSASAYGNQAKIENGGTTTGNKTGIYMYINRERVAVLSYASSSAYTSEANSKYINKYTSNDLETNFGVGDSMNIALWHGGGTLNYGNPVPSSRFGMLRSYYRICFFI